MRRGQIEFGESLMVVIILVFILIMGIVFYFNVTKRSLGQEQAYREDIEAVKLAKAALALPEVRCGSFSGSETCIDELKLRALADVISHDTDAKEYYGTLFGYAHISLHIIPQQGESTPTPIVLYEDKPATNVSATPQFIFTTLYDPVGGSQRLAYLNVTRYAKEAPQ
jgi:hypothetical protein